VCDSRSLLGTRLCTRAVPATASVTASKMIRTLNTTVGSCVNKPPFLLLLDIDLCGRKMTLGAVYRVLKGLFTRSRLARL
jgi:hypothetical protein